MKIKAYHKVLALAVLIMSSESHAYCFDKAAQRYQQSEQLLRAIAMAESNNNATAMHLNADGTEDIGLMQINSKHLGALGKLGITKSDLLEPCTNVMVGAWVLANCIQKYGFTWRAVGSYNTGTGRGRDPLRQKYVTRVKPIFEKLLKATAAKSASKAAVADTTVAISDQNDKESEQ